MTTVITTIWRQIESLAYYFTHYNRVGVYLGRIWGAFFELLGGLWFYLLAGILLSSALSVFWRPETIGRFFQTSQNAGKKWIVLSAILGVLSPVPLYAALPLLATLSKIGLPPGILFAFLISSPIMNPVLFFLTSGALGLEMAVMRTLSGLVLGVFAGFLVQYKFKDQSLIRDHVSGMKPETTEGTPLWTRYYREVRGLSRFAVKFFLIGIGVAAAVRELIPPEAFIALLGQNRELSVLAAVGAGIPLYACGGGTIPVMQALVALGLDKGPVLAFFISGPATKISTLVTLKAAVPKNIMGIYLGVTLLGATVLGLSYSLV